MEIVAQALLHFWVAVALHLWQTTLVLVPLMVLGWMLRNAPGRYQAAVAWAAIAKLLLPVAVVAPALAGIARALFPALAGGQVASARWVWISSVLDPVTSALRPSAASGRVAGVVGASLTLLWALGATWLISRWMGGDSDTGRGRPGGDSDVPAAERLAAALDGTSIPGACVRLVGDDGMPRVAGVFAPRILVPLRLAAGLAIEELRAILLHEEAHRRRRDPLRRAALRCVLMAFFFYPPVWLLVRRIHDAAEMDCDERAVSGGVPAEVFGRALAHTLALGLEPAGRLSAGALARASLLRRRILRIRGVRRIAAMNKYRLAVAASLLLVAAGSAYPTAADAPSVAVLPEFAKLEAANVPVQLRFRDQPFADVLDALSRAAGSFKVAAEGCENLRVSVDYPRMALQEWLSRLTSDTGVLLEVPNPRTLRAVCPVPFDEGMTPPERIVKVDPVYPEEARTNRAEGHVVLQTLIGTDGKVASVQVLRGVPDHPELERSAVDAVKQWVYRPALENGRPIAVYFTVQVEFTLT
jgi:TonB family protein